MFATRIAAALAVLWTSAAFAVQQPTTTAVYALNPAVDYGQPVTVSAVVQGSGGPTGSVQFTSLSGIDSTVALVNGTASFTTSSLPAGSSSIAANYLGDAGNQPSNGWVNISVRGLPPGITTVTPSHLPAGTLDRLIWIAGSNFQGTTEVLVDGTVIASITDSPTQLRAFLPASKLTTPGTRTISLRNFSSSLSAPVPPPFSFTVDAPGPAPLSIAISGSQATASHLTPGGGSAWLVATRIVDRGYYKYENSWVQLLTDTDADGQVTFDTALQPARVSVIPPDSMAGVIDVATGAFRVDVPADGHRSEAFFPIDAVITMKGNDAARIKTGAYYFQAVLVRPGVGAWWAQGTGGPDGITTASFRPLPGSPAVPPTFQANDVFVAMNNDRFVTARLGDYFPAVDPAAPFLSVEDARVLEGNSGFTDLNFDVRLSSAASSRVTVQLMTDISAGSATPGTDYEWLSTTVTFEPGDVVKTVPVRIYGDTLYEYQEIVKVALINATGAPIRFGSAIGTILNDDAAPVISIADAPAVVEDTNGQSGVLTFHVTLSAPSGAYATAYFTVPDGSATWEDVGDVYPDWVQIPPGATSGDLRIPLYPDQTDEDDEELRVKLYQISAATAGRILASGTIIDNDPSPLLAVAPLALVEGTGTDTILQVPLNLAGESARPMSVDYQVVTGGSVTASDVVVASGTVSVNAPGYFVPATTTLPVTIKGDALAEGPETFTILFSNPVNLRLPSPPSASITIADDDGPAGGYAATVLHDQPEAYYRLNEGAGTVARDASGHGRDGTYGATVGRNAAGALGSGDPAVTVPPYIYTGPATVTLPGTWGGPSWTEATLEGWVQLTPPAGQNDSLSIFEFSYGYNAGSFLNLHAGSYGNGATIYTDTQPNGFGFPATIPKTGWHHLAVVAKSGASAMYVDGVQVATSSQLFTYLAATTVPQTLGGANGAFDEVAVYHRALSAADVARHYALRADRRMAADFDGNGSADIVLRNPSTGANALWLMSGAAYASTLDLPWLPSDFRIEGAADFDADGQTDLLLRNYTNGNNALWLMNGTSIKAIANLPWLPVASQFRFEGTGDMNGDGSPDILIRNYTNGNNAVWLMNGTSFTGVADLPALPDLNYRMAGGGDFNGDGKPDIVWRNQTTGNNAVWLMNGLALGSVANLPPLPNTAYRFNAIADYDGDGSTDIVLRNYTTGADAIWLLNGVALKAIVNLPTLPNTAYEIMGPR